MCKYCDEEQKRIKDNYEIDNGYDQAYAIIEKSEGINYITSAKEIGTDSYIYSYHINFCPMCGRDLEEKYDRDEIRKFKGTI